VNIRPLIEEDLLPEEERSLSEKDRLITYQCDGITAYFFK